MWAVGVTGEAQWKAGLEGGQELSQKDLWTFPEGKGAFKEILAVKRARSLQNDVNDLFTTMSQNSPDCLDFDLQHLYLEGRKQSQGKITFQEGQTLSVHCNFPKCIFWMCISKERHVTSLLGPCAK